MMNYQNTALLIYAPLYVLFVVTGFGLAFMGLSAPIFYGLCMGLIFPVVLSMRLHTLSESGQALLLKETTHWTVYVQGIPVQETRSSLKNPCFSTPQRLQQFFRRTLFARLALQVASVAMLVQQVSANPLSIDYGAAAFVALIILLVPLYRTVLLMRKVHIGEWALQRVDGVEGYQAFFIDKKGARTALDTLLAIM
ncbi:hypothetical protein GA0061071_104258 [Kosakonia oryzendophytica]|uniref:Uncharacterized protein n=1 Tax=Kosakonia oryzendophytica TaxID=1005665 RepID=A0A1C4B9A3_9ENTR|nr:hypothetical protein [Kosakonia oryzendophytica]SCC03495.1 hypothetical protein GA0061071_104258 [Kosakonia oryzendophytica]